MAPCNDGKIVSFYVFFPAEMAQTRKEGFIVDDISIEDLIAPYTELDPDCVLALRNSIDRKPWRLYKHSPLTKWTEKNVALLGDACHAMMPHQSQ
jgi:salicylate hydroxylase